MADSDTQAVLFDIDGTLISTGGASDRAWKRAFKELQGVDVDVPAVTGKGVPDPEVGRVVFKAALGRDSTDEEAEALMRRRLDTSRRRWIAPPGSWSRTAWRSSSIG
jgi:phosphoglycolate phosphatase